MSNVFLKPVEYYQRRIDPVGQYVDQSAFYLSKMSGKDIGKCKEYIVQGLRGKKFAGAQDPIVDHFERNDFGDREKKQVPLTSYIKSTVQDGQILVPTFTTYKPTSEERSLLSEFIGRNVKRRATAKHEAAAADAVGNKNLAEAKNNEQANMKTYNNSMSGAFAAEGSVLQNPTGHNTLTSITRSMASVGNALNEKIIGGNRHYRNPDVTLYDIIAVASTMDKDAVSSCIRHFNLHLPTTEETVEVIRWSTDQFYWKDNKAMATIVEFLDKLEPIERAAFVYTQDLYHVARFNPEFMRGFLEDFARKELDPSIEDPYAFMKTVDPLVVNYAHQVCMVEVKGKGTDHKKMDIETVAIVASVCKNINEMVVKYKPFIDALFLTKLVPSGTAYIPAMMRRVVVLSDTDSTMFSVDWWVTWYFGELIFSDRAFAIAGAVMFFATQCIAHCLAILSANIGVERERIFTLAMKPEFVFPVFAQTNVAKHYFTFIMVKEGAVYKELKPEFKGQVLRNSAAPGSIVKAAQDKMLEILHKVMSNEKISIVDEVKDVANLERKITSSLFAGETEFFKKSKVKEPTAYALGPLKSMYQHHVFWEMVFQPKYGSIAPPPYSVIKIPTTLTTPSGTKKWLDELSDRELADRFKAWMDMHGKKKLPTVYLSLDYVEGFKIPMEITSIINVKKILLDLTGMRRMILESLGYQTKAEWVLSELGY